MILADLMARTKPDEMSANCRLWTGHITNEGMPRYSHKGIRGSVRRAIIELTTGKPVRKEDFVSCTCGNRHCVAPEHLIVRTPIQMQQLMLERTSNSAERIRRQKISNAKRKLTDAQIQEIMNSDETHRQLAERLGVTRAVISEYRRGKLGKFTKTNPFSGLMSL